MKYKNYKSAIHNYTHSFMSIDYLKSGRLAVNVLIDLYNLGLDTKATFDFISQTIHPIDAESKASRKLMNDYLDWLPDHFSNHNCDLSKLDHLKTTIWIDFDKGETPKGMSNQLRFIVNAITEWKVAQRDIQTIEISQEETIKVNFLKLRIPEMK